MTPKEKAHELVGKYVYHARLERTGSRLPAAKECALIAVEEILRNNCGANTDGQQAYEDEIYCDEYYWDEVKTEIEKL